MILVSACLAGVPCRMDGKSKPCREIAELVAAGEAVMVCPEVMGGLPTPRVPSEILEGRVVNREGRDVTEAFAKGAEKALAVCRENGCTAAILKARSPSCGKGEVYDGHFTRTLVPGNGIFAQRLLAEGIRVMTEEEWNSGEE